MIICDRFVYVHMPKTGGTFVRHALRRLLAGCGVPFIDDRENKHAGVECIPDAYRHLPVLATIRNPFDHYVSLYEFGWWKDHAEDTFDERAIRRRFAYYPEISFEEYLCSVYDWSLLSASYVDGTIRDEFQSAGLGPLTLDYIRYFSGSPASRLNDVGSLSADEFAHWLTGITFLRTERLNDDLQRALARFGFGPDELDFIAQSGKAFPPGSRRDQCRGWTGYYTPEMKQLVRDRERLLFAVFADFDVEA